MTQVTTPQKSKFGGKERGEAESNLQWNDVISQPYRPPQPVGSIAYLSGMMRLQTLSRRVVNTHGKNKKMYAII
jgi:hypothetical protein